MAWSAQEERCGRCGEHGSSGMVGVCEEGKSEKISIHSSRVGLHDMAGFVSARQHSLFCYLCSAVFIRMLWCDVL